MCASCEESSAVHLGCDRGQRNFQEFSCSVNQPLKWLAKSRTARSECGQCNCREHSPVQMQAVEARFVFHCHIFYSFCVQVHLQASITNPSCWHAARRLMKPVRGAYNGSSLSLTSFKRCFPFVSFFSVSADRCSFAIRNVNCLFTASQLVQFTHRSFPIQSPAADFIFFLSLLLISLPSGQMS